MDQWLVLGNCLALVLAESLRAFRFSALRGLVLLVMDLVQLGLWALLRPMDSLNAWSFGLGENRPAEGSAAALPPYLWVRSISFLVQQLFRQPIQVTLAWTLPSP